MKDNRSFFEKLTGGVKLDETDDAEGLESKLPKKAVDDAWMEEDALEGQLTIDVYQTPSEIVIKTMVAGVKPEDLDISITRDMVTIKGKRATERFDKDEDHF